MYFLESSDLSCCNYWQVWPRPARPGSG